MCGLLYDYFIRLVGNFIIKEVQSGATKPHCNNERRLLQFYVIRDPY